eukprot:95377-Alexandrium_andersonii.AAC.1
MSAMIQWDPCARAGVVREWVRDGCGVGARAEMRRRRHNARWANDCVRVALRGLPSLGRPPWGPQTGLPEAAGPKA